MNLLIIGSGAREHAFASKIKESKHEVNIFATNPNQGINFISNAVKVDVNDFNQIKNVIIKYSISFVLVGPEIPLINGIVDFIKADPVLYNVSIIGPSKSGSRLEGSKEFAKKFMNNHNIPTASYMTFSKETLNEGIEFIKNNNPPYVLKADGPAAGKGVIIVEAEHEAITNLKEMLIQSKFGESSDKVVIEEFLTGIEMSCFVLFDGLNYKILPYAKDYKRIGERDKGLNTGGMGSISPVNFLNKNIKKQIEKEIIEPTINGLISEKIDYVGFIFIGLINVNGQPKVIEYNVRMGDPECQTILPKLKTDLLEIIEACCDKKLADINIEWTNKKSLCVVLCSKGYPDTYQKNILINNLENFNLDENNFIFHAGTKKENDEIYAIGGRVLNFISLSDNFLQARDEVHQSLKKLDWNGGFYRRDIGFKVIN